MTKSIKTLKDFTPEIQAKIPQYIEKYTKGVFDGKRYEAFNQESAETLIHYNYDKCGYKKPVVLVAENPYESQLFLNYIRKSKHFLPFLYLIFLVKNKLEIPTSLKGLQKGVDISGQLDDQLYGQLGDQLRGQLGGQLRGQLRGQLGDQLYDQLRGQLDDQLGGQLRGQLDDQLHYQLYDQLDDQLDDQLGGQLYDQLYDQLGGQLHGQLDDQLRGQLGGQLHYQLDDQLGGYNNDYLFTCNVYSNAYFSWYKFIKDEFNIECEVGVTLDSFHDMYMKSNVYSAVFTELVCIVSRYPKKIHRNENNDLHNTKDVAVEWESSCEQTKWNCHYINGRRMPEWIFKEFTKEQFLKEENEDVRAGMYEIIEARGEGCMLSFLDAKEIDKQTFTHGNGELEEMTLYVTNENFEEEEDLNGNSPAPLAWLKMSCPSTNQMYLIPSDGSFKDCVSAAKYHRPEAVPNEIYYFWDSRN